MPSPGCVSSARGAPSAARRKRRINQPWSLLLQLAALCLLVLAIAELQFGGGRNGIHHHVLILDSSAWMNSVRPGSSRTLMEEARADAERWLSSIPSTDRVLLIGPMRRPCPPLRSIRAMPRSGVPSPRRSQERRRSISIVLCASPNRRATRPDGLPAKLFSSAPGAPRTKNFCRRHPGKLRFFSARLRRTLRVAPHQRASFAHGWSEWNVVVSVKNYGRRPHTAGLALSLSGVPLVARELTIATGGEQTSSLPFARAPPDCSKRGCLPTRRLRAIHTPPFNCPPRDSWPFPCTRIGRTCCGRCWRAFPAERGLP